MTQVASLRSASLLKIVAVFVLALSGVVAAFATIAPSPETILPGQELLREPYPIDLQTALLPPPEAYVRESRLERGDRLNDLYTRLGIDAVDGKRLTSFYAMHRLRIGTMVRAEVEPSGRFRRLSFLDGRGKVVRFTHSGENIDVSLDDVQTDVV